MVTIKNLRKYFKTSAILKDLNLIIEPTQRVALIGHNGCGKTTLIRCLLGLYQFEGEIDIFGINIKKEREKALKKIAFVPQTPPALKGTVEEILTLTADLCEVPMSQIHLVASELGLVLNNCLSIPFKSLSGGMKQKLLIAIALARRPALLIMDEPSANLDPKARAVFFRLLSELPKETTILLTSHRVDELSGIVSRVIELDNGIIAMDDIVEATTDDSALSEKSFCTLKLKKLPDSVRAALLDWSFKNSESDLLSWSGIISSADRFRFHATLTRWSGIIEAVSIKKSESEDKDDKTT